LLFDIDGVIRDVGGSYRRAIAETVHHYSGWRPDPGQIDALKAEGCWNNDWEASAELLRRRSLALAQASSDGPASLANPEGCAEAPASAPLLLPPFAELVEVFGGFYFGGDPEGDPALWRGLIGQEPLLVEPCFFRELDAAGILWGFVSGAEPASARYVLQQRLGLDAPPLIAMGDAPDKPDPSGLLRLAEQLLSERWGLALGPAAPPVAYLGDTVADVHTVIRARRQRPEQRFFSLAVAPPHLHGPDQGQNRSRYEQQLLAAGADRILASTVAVPSELLVLVEGVDDSVPFS